MKRITMAAAVAAALALVGGRPAGAVNFDASGNASLTIDGWTFDASCPSCTTNYEMVQDGSNFGVTFLNPGGDLVNASPVNVGDLAISMTASGSTPITGMTFSFTGYATNSQDELNVFPVENVFDGASNQLALLSPTLASPSASASFAPQTYLQLDKDLGVIATLDTVGITTATQDFYVPEPASAALLLSGLGAMLAMVRRPRRA